MIPKTIFNVKEKNNPKNESNVVKKIVYMRI